MGKRAVRRKDGSPQYTEGLLYFSFVFNGKRYVKQHTLSEFETSHMKDMLRQHGHQAIDQLVFNMAIKGAGILGENMVAHAALDFLKELGLMDVADISGAAEASSDQPRNILELPAPAAEE